jgi:hypothetical protein
MKHSTNFGIDACDDRDGRHLVHERLLQRGVTLNWHLRRREFFARSEMFSPHLEVRSQFQSPRHAPLWMHAVLDSQM